MKTSIRINKRVESGCIKISGEIKGENPLPAGTRFTTPSYQGPEPERIFDILLQKISIGDFEINCNTSGRYFDKAMSVDDIYEAVETRITDFVDGYNEFVAENTGSVEILPDVQAVVERLIEKTDICYRDRSGKFQKLNI